MAHVVCGTAVRSVSHETGVAAEKGAVARVRGNWPMGEWAAGLIAQPFPLLIGTPTWEQSMGCVRDLVRPSIGGCSMARKFHMLQDVCSCTRPTADMSSALGPV